MEFSDRQIDPLRLDPPNNDDLFEDFCCDLARDHLNMPGAQRFGRSGHSQNGVDIAGIDNVGIMIGIQCKKKNRLLKGKLTVTDVENEIKEALKFNPPLERYIIASTLPRDPELQSFALKTTLDLFQKSRNS